MECCEKRTVINSGDHSGIFLGNQESGNRFVTFFSGLPTRQTADHLWREGVTGHYKA